MQGGETNPVSRGEKQGHIHTIFLRYFAGEGANGRRGLAESQDVMRGDPLAAGHMPTGEGGEQGVKGVFAVGCPFLVFWGDFK